MVNIAVLGYGVVGSGVAEVVKKNNTSIAARAGKTIYIKKILDIRDFPESPDRDVLTKNADEVFDDPEISIIAETIGGVGIAYEFTKRALNVGKHVVSSNKELVATHGPELLTLAKNNGVNYLFEASVGGGIPIIRPLNQCLAANEIHEITGILNGTTNYILTQMRKKGKGFNEALKGAQEKGYAEADPTADIEGHDACRKIAILSSIAYNEFVDYKQIHTEGISRVSLEDMQYAEEMDSVIKLIATSRKIGDRIFARVSPAIVSKSNSLANVEDVFNAIVVKGDAIGEAMFYGRGAGKLPTASAVVADIIDIVKHPEGSGRNSWVVRENNMMGLEQSETRYFIRVKVDKTNGAEDAVKELFGTVDWVRLCRCPEEEEIAFVTGHASEEQLQSRMKRLTDVKGVQGILNILRILDN